MNTALIDTTFDVRCDTPTGQDPDSASATLKGLHRRLWSKPLPVSGSIFRLEPASGGYLRHQSALGDFWMNSDSVVHTYRGWTRFGLPEVVRRIDETELAAFETLSFTIGAMMLFPSWTGERHWSINQARGLTARIADRMDLTLECIRRRYAGIASPMTKTLAWYDDFFALFGDLIGFAEFFLLDDLLTPDRANVDFFLPFDDFTRVAAVPVDVAEYRTYMAASMQFVRSRNARIRSEYSPASATT